VTTADEPLEASSLLTTVGLLIEAQAGLVASSEQRLHEHGHVTGQSFEILLRLLRTPGHRLRMSDLAAQTTLTASGLTRAVDRLEREDLVAREACAVDRRVSYAVLTEAGAAKIRAALRVHVAHLREIFERFDPDELLELEGLLRRLRDILNPTAASASAPDCAVPPDQPAA
jgi:MarR family transcriptional regulator, 2-MHQ and catechol-resistance regulon repressor